MRFGAWLLIFCEGAVSNEACISGKMWRVRRRARVRTDFPTGLPSVRLQKAGGTTLDFLDGGHVQTKCKACGRETDFNVLEMRRLRRLQLYYSSLNG